MKKKLAKIYKYKAYYKTTMKELSIKYLNSIIESLYFHETQMQLIARLRKQTLKSPLKSTQLMRTALVVAKQMISKIETAKKEKQDFLLFNDNYVNGKIENDKKKQLNEHNINGKKDQDLKVMPTSSNEDLFLAVIISTNPIAKFNQVINTSANLIEREMKDEMLNSAFTENRKLKEPLVFYLCSQHKDCAKDHVKYQGKIYIDEQWRDFVKDTEMVKDIERVIKSKQPKTVQYITDSPVFLLTRPYCRHYFKPISIKELFDYDINVLLKKKKMYSEQGKQLYQTIYNKKAKMETVNSNIEIYKKLYELTKNELYKTKLLKEQIIKEKLEKYLKSKE